MKLRHTVVGQTAAGKARLAFLNHRLLILR